MAPNNIPPHLKHRHARLALRRPTLPPLLLDVDQNAAQYTDSPLFFGPGLGMYIPDGSSEPDQIPQQTAPPGEPEVNTAPLIAASQAPFFVPSNSVSATLKAQQPSARVSPSPSLISTTITQFITASSTRPAQTSSSAPPPFSATQQANTANTPSQPQTQSQSRQSQSQSITTLVASTPTSTGTSQSPSSTSSTTPTSESHSHDADLTSSVSTSTASAALASSSSAQAATHPENLPHLAEIVLGVVAAISIIAFLATLISWYYKQRKRRRNHLEIVSLNSSAYEHGSRGLFGCLKRRRNKNPEDMSELGFGLSHVDFFGAPNSGDDDHRVGLALGPENVLHDGEDRKSIMFPSRMVIRDPFVSQGFTEGPYPTVRPLPVHISNPTPSSTSISPSRYQHLGGVGATPLTVANLAPGDFSSDESGSGDDRRRGSAWSAPQPVARVGSLGTPRRGSGAPRFTTLAEGDGLTVPWAPLNVGGYNAERGGIGEQPGFEPLSLSRTSTLSLALSRTFSQRLEHSLSMTADWKDGTTRPPRGTFRAAWDQTAPEKLEDGAPGQDNWAATIRNNFYSALNAMSGSGVGTKGGTSRSHTGSVSTLPNPYSDTSRQSSMHFLSSKSRRTQASLEDILAPPLARNALAGRTKGSIIRGKLEMDEYGHVGLGIDALSRSSTLSTTWSGVERISDAAWTAQHTRVLDREARRSRLIRTGTGSTTSSSEPVRATVRQTGRGQSSRAPSKRPRYSRMPVSQSSIWSSESYATSGTGERR